MHLGFCMRNCICLYVEGILQQSQMYPRFVPRCLDFTFGNVSMSAGASNVFKWRFRSKTGHTIFCYCCYIILWCFHTFCWAFPAFRALELVALWGKLCCWGLCTIVSKRLLVQEDTTAAAGIPFTFSGFSLHHRGFARATFVHKESWVPGTRFAARDKLQSHQIT